MSLVFGKMCLLEFSTSSCDVDFVANGRPIMCSGGESYSYLVWQKGVRHTKNLPSHTQWCSPKQIVGERLYQWLRQNLAGIFACFALCVKTVAYRPYTIKLCICDKDNKDTINLI